MIHCVQETKYLYTHGLYVVRVMLNLLNAKSSIISIVLPSSPCRVGQGLKHFKKFTRDNLKQFTTFNM